MIFTPRLLQDVLIASTRRAPDSTALVVGSVRLSYSDLLAVSCRVAHLLQAEGVRRGDRVAIFMDNSWWFVAALWGTLLAGGVFVAINSQTKHHKLDFILRNSGVYFLLTQSSLAREFVPAMKKLPALRVYCTKGKMRSANVFCLETELAAMPTTPPPQTGISTDLAALLYTSGTTGEATGVMHSHQSLLFVLDSINEYLGLCATDRLLCVLPLTFGYGLFQMFSAIRAGGLLVLERSFTYPIEVFQRIQAEEVTCFAGVPTMFSLILSHDARQPLRFPSVRLLTNAAAALPAEFLSALRRIFPAADIVKMYGQTECIRIAYLDATLAEAKPLSVGGAIPGTELLLLNDNGQPVAPGEVGTLFVRGPHLMRGYWNKEEKTAATLVPAPSPGERMLNTGDQFRRDANGDLYFVSRIDDIIKCRGEKVSPVEVENAIYLLPGIEDVVVAGIPDPVLGQAVCAFVTLRRGAHVSEQEIRQICNERLENYMQPKRILFLPKLLRTANNKFSRRLLLETHAALLANEEKPL
jgi:long-chain acyl-CoA synthetase